MVLECLWNFVGCGAAIERHSEAQRKREHALCPIHTTPCVNPECAAHCRLTGFRASRPRRPSLYARRRKFRRGLNLSPRGAYLSKATSHLLGIDRRMGQQLQPWRSADGQKLWLSMLIDAMEEASRPEFRAV